MILTPEDFHVYGTHIVRLLKAKNRANCSFCDKSMKLGQITKFTKGIILGYGATRNKHPEQSTAHALKWPCMETRLDIINDING